MKDNDDKNAPDNDHIHENDDDQYRNGHEDNAHNSNDLDNSDDLEASALESIDLSFDNNDAHLITNEESKIQNAATQLAESSIADANDDTYNPHSPEHQSNSTIEDMYHYIGNDDNPFTIDKISERVRIENDKELSTEEKQKSLSEVTGKLMNFFGSAHSLSSSSQYARKSEIRIMFDAAALSTWEEAQQQEENRDENEDDVQNKAAEEALSQERREDLLESAQGADVDHIVEKIESPNEIIFIDSNVDDLDTLLSGLKDDTLYFMIDDKSDGLQQISDILSNYHDVGAVHIVSHGGEGILQLGAEPIDFNQLSDGQAENLRIMGDYLHQDGDILIYGCDFGADAQGRDAVNNLAELTGADVTASDDMTGGGDDADWDLEVQSDGAVIESDIVFSQQSRLNYQAQLSFATASGNSYVLNDATTQIYNGLEYLGAFHEERALEASTAVEGGSPTGSQASDGDAIFGAYDFSGKSNDLRIGSIGSVNNLREIAYNFTDGGMGATSVTAGDAMANNAAYAYTFENSMNNIRTSSFTMSQNYERDIVQAIGGSASAQGNRNRFIEMGLFGNSADGDWQSGAGNAGRSQIVATTTTGGNFLRVNPFTASSLGSQDDNFNSINGADPSGTSSYTSTADNVNRAIVSYGEINNDFTIASFGRAAVNFYDLKLYSRNLTNIEESMVESESYFQTRSSRIHNAGVRTGLDSIDGNFAVDGAFFYGSGDGQMNGSYDYQLRGVMRESGESLNSFSNELTALDIRTGSGANAFNQTINRTEGSGGLGITNQNFLNNDNDRIFVAHNNLAGTTSTNPQAPNDVDLMLNRSWAVQVDDASNNGGFVQLNFDLSQVSTVLGNDDRSMLPLADASSADQYRVLWRAKDGDNWQVLNYAGNPRLNGNNVGFFVNIGSGATDLKQGQITLGLAGLFEDTKVENADNNQAITAQSNGDYATIKNEVDIVGKFNTTIASSLSVELEIFNDLGNRQSRAAQPNVNIANDGTWTLEATGMNSNGFKYVYHVRDEITNYNQAFTILIDQSIDAAASLNFDDSGLGAIAAQLNASNRPILKFNPDNELSYNENLDFLTVTLRSGNIGQIGTFLASQNFTFPSALTNREYALTAVINDSAGNSATINAETIILDTQITNSTMDLNDADDIGRSSIDNITADTRPTFFGSAARPGDSVSIFASGTRVGSAIVGGDLSALSHTDFLRDVGWTVSTDFAAAGDGNHLVSAVVNDYAGNVRTVMSYTVTIDTSISYNVADISAPALEVGSDSGVAGDRITNIQQPIFTGTVNNSHADRLIVLEYHRNGTVLRSDYVTPSGSGANLDWTVLSPSLDDGSYEVRAFISETSGAINDTLFKSMNLVIDTESTLNVADRLKLAGNLANTDTQTVDYVGKFTSAGTMIISYGNAEIGRRQGNAGDTWTLTAHSLPGDASTSAQHVVSSKFQDTAGNIVNYNYRFNYVHTIYSASTPDLLNDAGASNVDNITGGSAVQIRGGVASGGAGSEGPTNPGETARVTITTVSSGAQVIATTLVADDGFWTLQRDFPSQVGQSIQYSVTARVDQFGNTGAVSSPLNITIEATFNSAGTAQMNAILDGALAADSGSSDSDRISNVKNPRFNGVEASPGSIAKVVDANNIDIVYGQAAVGVNSAWQVDALLPEDGTYSLTVYFYDPFNNRIQASEFKDAQGNVMPNQILTYILDTQANTPDDLDLSVNLDSGRSNTDNITSRTDLTFTGSGDGGDAVILFDGANTVASAMIPNSGNWTLSAHGQSDGIKQYQVAFIDTAGNSKFSTPLAVTIDTSVASAVSYSLLSTDTGNSDSDRLINTPNFTVRASGAENQDIAIFAVEEQDTAVNRGTSTVVVDASRADLALSGLSDGTYNIRLSYTDAAGNISAGGGVLTVILDTTVNVVTQTAVEDNFGNANDNAIGSNRPVFTGKGTGNTLSLFLGRDVFTQIITPNTSWTFTAPQLVADGRYNVRTLYTDDAGNTAQGDNVDLLIDTQTTPGRAPDLDASRDSGVFDNDNFTAFSSLLVRGEEVDAGATVELVVNNVRTGSIVVANAQGEWSMRTGNLAQNTYGITARVTDLGGNVAVTGALTVIIDTAAPAPITSGFLKDDNDLGASNRDQITNVNAPGFQFTGGEAGATARVFANGTLINSAKIGPNTTWIIDNPGVILDDGTYTLEALVTDTAGNLVPRAVFSTFVVDTSIASIQNLTLTNDAYLPGDNIINRRDIKIKAETSEPGLTATILDLAGNQYGSTIISGTSHEFQLTAGQFSNDGNYNLRIRYVDTAGNVRFSPTQRVTIDTVMSFLGDTPSLTVDQFQDQIVSDRTPVLTGGATLDTGQVVQASAGDTVRLYHGDSVLATTFVAADGFWTITSSTLNDGKYNLGVKFIDSAGNESNTIRNFLTVTIDTTLSIPSGAAPSLLVDSDTGVQDNSTSVTNPFITGYAEFEGDTVSLYYF